MLTWLAALAAAAAVVTADPVKSCYNGGFLMNGECHCSPLFQGPQCGEIVCLNGGYPSKNASTTCICPVGYLGVHCDAQSAVAVPPSALTVPNTFNLLILNNLTNYWGRSGLKALKGVLLSDAALTGNLYDEHNLFTGRVKDKNSKNVTWSIDSSDKGHEFLDAVNKTEFSRTRDYTCWKVDGMWKKILELIKAQSLQQTTLTVFSQHPPADDDAAFRALVQHAVAFGIKINWLFVEDETFLRCTAANWAGVRALADQTHATHATIQYRDPPAETTIMTSLIALHHKPQLVAYASGKNGAVEVPFHPDHSVAQDYSVVVYQPDGTLDLTVSGNCLRSGGVIYSLYKKVAVLSLMGVAAGDCVLKIQSKDTADITAKIVRSSAYTDSLSQLVSFVEAPTLDTSNAMPYGDSSLFVALRPNVSTQISLATAALTITGQFVDASGTNTSLTFEKRADATFTYISNEKVAAVPGMDSWIELVLSVQHDLSRTYDHATSYFFQRVIPVTVATVPPQPTTTTAPTTTGQTTTIGQTTTQAATTVVVTTTTAAATTTQMPKPGPTRASPLSRLTLVYSNAVSDQTWNDVAVPATNSPELFSDYASVRFDVLDKPVVYETANNTSQFYDNVYTNFPPAKENSSDEAATDLDTVLQQLSVADSVENQLVSMLVTRLPSAKLDITKYPSLLNRDARINVFVPVGTLNEMPLRRQWTTAPLQLLTSLTGGHLIAYNDTDFANATIHQTALSSIIQDNFAAQSAQQLLFAGTYLAGVDNQLGQMAACNTSIDVVVTASTFINGLSDVVAPYIAHVTIGSQTVTLSAYGKTNFMQGAVTLQPSGMHKAISMLAVFIDGKSRNMDVRVWRKRSSTDIPVAITYNDLADETIVDGPNSIDGVAARVGVHSAASVSISLRDCRGRVSTLAGHTQSEPAGNGGGPDLTSAFAPVFCNSVAKSQADCLIGWRGLYHMDVAVNATDGSTLMFSRPVFCSDNAAKQNGECQTFDKDGNQICTGSSAPFLRGPTGQVYDCSAGGPDSHLEYNKSGVTKSGKTAPSHYLCKCAPGYAGDTCEQGVCAHENTAGGAIDNSYRTYTVFVAIDWNDCQADPVDNLMDAQAHYASAAVSYDGVWLFQLYLVVDNGDAPYPLYIGPRFSEFRAAFDISTVFGQGGNHECGSPVNGTTINVDDLYALALRPIGETTRGIVVVDYAMYLANLQPSTVQMRRSLDDFYAIAQRYKQELYVFSYADANGLVTLSPSVRLAAAATAGVALSTQANNLDDEVISTKARHEFGKMLTDGILDQHTTIGWADYGVVPSKDAVQRTVTIEDGATAYVIGEGVNAVVITDCNGIGDGHQLFPPTGTNADTNAVVYKIPAKKFCVEAKLSSTADASPPQSYSILVINGTPMSAMFTMNRVDDASTALAVSSTVAGPSLAVHLPTGWELTNMDGLSRTSARQNCTYQTLTYDVANKFADGVNVIRMKIHDASQPTATYSRVLPVTATAAIACQHGSYSKTLGGCECVGAWKGAACNQPDCGQGQGSLNAWSTACNVCHAGADAACARP